VAASGALARWFAAVPETDGGTGQYRKTPPGFLLSDGPDGMP